MESFFAQLRQRQIFKVATIYAVAAWPLIQIADLAVPALGLPDSVMTLLLKIFIVGFPISLIFAWLFNFTTEGIVRVDDKNDSQLSNESGVNFRTTIAVAGSLVIALSITIVSQLMMENNQQVSEITEKNKSSNTLVNPPSLSEKKESIAILPFVPFSSDPEDEYFADGMVEELLNLMAKIPDLKVAARTSSFAYKGIINKTIMEIGQELGVDTILEGSIRKNDTTNKIRVTAQLIKVSTGEHLWSETYDREYRDIFKIQDEIASAVVDKMKITLLGESAKQPFDVGTNSVDAMVEYGKGKKELAHRTAQSIEKALTHFNKAVLNDSNYARAYVGIADANILLALYGNHPEENAKINAQQAIDKALAINSQLGEAYASQGLLLSSTDKKQAESFFKKAIALNPNYAMTYMWYGSIFQESGDIEGAHHLFEQAFQLDPKSPVAAYNVAWCYYQVGDEEKAMDLFSQIISNDPYYPGAYNLVGDILMNRGRLDESIKMYKRAIAVDAENKGAIKGLLLTHMDLGNIKESESWFDYAEKKSSLFSQPELIYLQARLSATNGNLEQAISYLEQVDFGKSAKKMKHYIDGELAFYKGNYHQAVKEFEALKANNNINNAFYYMTEGQAAVHLAYSYLLLNQQNKAEEVINNFENFLQEGNNKKNQKPLFYYNMALVRSLQNDQDQVFEYLQGAIDAGWVQIWKVQLDPIFSPIRDNSRLNQMIGGVEAKLANMRAKLKAENDFF